LWRHRCVPDELLSPSRCAGNGTDFFCSFGCAGLGAMYEWSDIVQLVVDEYKLKRKQVDGA
jgi:hypothetical protein